MGLFDTVRSSYNLGEELTEVELQTKDIGATMDFYWISPNGQLWTVDLLDTADFEKIDDSILGFKWIPNGNHGKVKPVDLTDYIRAYRVVDGRFVECRIHFKNGVVQEVYYHKDT